MPAKGPPLAEGSVAGLVPVVTPMPAAGSESNVIRPKRMSVDIVPIAPVGSWANWHFGGLALPCVP